VSFNRPDITPQAKANAQEDKIFDILTQQKQETRRAIMLFSGIECAAIRATGLLF